LRASICHEQVPGVPLMRRGVSRVELQRTLVLFLGSLPFPTIQIERQRQRGMGLRRIVIERDGFDRGVMRFGSGLLWREDAVLPIAGQGVGIRQAGVGRRLRGIHLDRMIEVLNGLIEAVAGALVRTTSE
jgi:hypothetical protein